MSHLEETASGPVRRHSRIGMAGMAVNVALGSWLFGRLGQRAARPIRWYAVLEFGLAATALASPLLFTWVDGLYGAAW